MEPPDECRHGLMITTGCKICGTWQTKEQAVDHPPHYNQGKIEVIDAIVDWQLNFARGNAVKYLVRAGRKSDLTELEDLRKAMWYLNFEITNLEMNKK